MTSNNYGFGLAEVKKEGHSYCPSEPHVKSWPTLSRECHAHYEKSFSPLVKRLFGRIFKPIVTMAWDTALHENARKEQNDDT